MNEAMPCGHCDGGIYSVDAVLGAMSYIAKEKAIPPCKKINRLCVGIQDAIEQLPTVSKAVEYLMM